MRGENYSETLSHQQVPKIAIPPYRDWGELLQTIGDTNAKTVWVTHGREDALVYWCRQQGLAADPLALPGLDDDGGEGGA